MKSFVYILSGFAAFVLATIRQHVCHTYWVLFADLSLKVVVDMYTRGMAQSTSYTCMGIWSLETIPYIYALSFTARATTASRYVDFLPGLHAALAVKQRLVSSTFSLDCARQIIAATVSNLSIPVTLPRASLSPTHARTYTRTLFRLLTWSLAVSLVPAVSRWCHVRTRVDLFTSNKAQTAWCLCRVYSGGLSMFGDAASKAYCTQIYLCCQRWINTWRYADFLRWSVKATLTCCWQWNCLLVYLSSISLEGYY